MAESAPNAIETAKKPKTAPKESGISASDVFGGIAKGVGKALASSLLPRTTGFINQLKDLKEAMEKKEKKKLNARPKSNKAAASGPKKAPVAPKAPKPQNPVDANEIKPTDEDALQNTQQYYTVPPKEGGMNPDWEKAEAFKMMNLPAAEEKKEEPKPEPAPQQPAEEPKPEPKKEQKGLGDNFVWRPDVGPEPAKEASNKDKLDYYKNRYKAWKSARDAIKQAAKENPSDTLDKYIASKEFDDPKAARKQINVNSMLADYDDEMEAAMKRADFYQRKYDQEKAMELMGLDK